MGHAPQTWLELTTLAVAAALRLASAVSPRFPLKENSLGWLDLLGFRLVRSGRFTYVCCCHGK